MFRSEGPTLSAQAEGLGNERRRFATALKGPLVRIPSSSTTTGPYRAVAFSRPDPQAFGLG